MSFISVAAVGGGASVLGGIIQGNAASSAANTEANAANQASQIQQQEFNTIQGENAPYRQAGTQALTEMQNPAFQQGFTMADFSASPGYQFALSQGQNALNASQAAQGNNVSGAGLAALSNYNQGMANQQYQQAFQNFNQTQNQNYSRLSTLANLGQGANAQSAQAGMNYANQSGADIMAAGNAQAAGQTGVASAISGAIGGVANAYGTGQALNMASPAPNNPYTAPSQNGTTNTDNFQVPQTMSGFGTIASATT